MIKFAKAIFGNTDFLTAQAFVYKRDDFLNQPGSVLLLCIITASGEDIFTKVRQTGLDLEEVFFDSDKTIPERIKEGLDFIQKNVEVSQGLQAQIVFWQENVLYIQSIGDQNAYIFRESNLINLSSKDNQLISGHIQPGDRMLLLSPRFQDEVGSQQTEIESKWDDKFINQLINTTPDQLDEEVSELLRVHGHIEPIAVVLVDNQVVQDFATPDKVDIPNIGGGDNTIENESQVHESKKPELPIAIKKALPPIGSNLKKLFTFLSASRKRLTFSIIFVLLVISFGFVLFSNNKKQQQVNNKVESLLSQAQSSFNQAQALKDTNSEEAKRNLTDANDKLSQAEKIKPDHSKLKDLKQQVIIGSKDILKITEISNFPVFLTLDLIKKDFAAKRMSYSLGKVLMLDQNSKTLVLLDLAKKTNQILAGPQQLGNGMFESLNGENVLVFSKDKGVIKVSIDDQKSTQVVKPDEAWGNIADIVGFSGNAYLIDSLKNQIYKYIGLKNTFSEKISYLNDGQQPDFSSTKRMRIDYSVWILKSGPDIIKYTAGEKDNFSIGGLDKPITDDIPNIFVPEDEEVLYILDRANSRVVVVKKDGQYTKQYVGDKFKSADDLLVTEEGKKMYLLEGNKIFLVELK